MSYDVALPSSYGGNANPYASGGVHSMPMRKESATCEGSCGRPSPEQTLARARGIGVNDASIVTFMNLANGLDAGQARITDPKAVPADTAKLFAADIYSGRADLSALSQSERAELKRLSTMMVLSPEKFDRVYNLDGRPEDLSSNDFLSAERSGERAAGTLSPDNPGIFKLDGKDLDAVFENTAPNDQTFVGKIKEGKPINLAVEYSNLDNNPGLVPKALDEADDLTNAAQQGQAADVLANAGILDAKGQQNGLQDYLVKHANEPFAKLLINKIKEAWGIDAKGESLYDDAGSPYQAEAQALEKFAKSNPVMFSLSANG